MSAHRPDASAVGHAVEHADELVRRASVALAEAAEAALALPEPPGSRWHRAGVTPRGERVFNVLSGLLLALFTTGWTWSIVEARASSANGAGGAPSATARIATALTDPNAPSTAYLTDAALSALTPLLGRSGKLRARIGPAGAPLPVDTLPPGAALAYPDAPGARGDSMSVPATPPRPGIWQLAVRAGTVLKPLADFSVITLTPRSAKRDGRIGLYYLGHWPGERGRRARPGYAPPSGFIEVTPENQDTYVSEHFRLRDFLTHDQQDVWPKYLVLREELVDKLELVLADLSARGHAVQGVQVMSGFRTPQYNRSGGDPRGRAELSRHMYGDAADVFVDADGNGVMDDLNGDGRVNIRDARIVADAVDRVEDAYPALIGGAGVYPAASGHGPFIHIDTRGYRARWVGSGDD